MNRAGGSSYKNTKERIWLAKQTKVICDHFGGSECYDCKFNQVTNGEISKEFFCQNAMNDLSGDIVTLIKP